MSTGAGDVPARGEPAMPPEAERYVAETERRAAAIDWSAMLVWRDVACGPGPHQRLNVFAPKATRAAPLPILFYVHGGGWTHGCRSWMEFMAPAAAALPAVFVSPGYGLAPDHLHPSPVLDCLRALAHARTHAAEFGGDPDRLYIGGHSVGGHIASMIALRPDLRARFHLPDGAIRACIPVSGLFRVLAGDPTGATDLDEASPVHWTGNADMPFHVSWGENDYERIIEENREFTNALRETNVDLRAEPLAGLDHYSANLSNGDRDGAWCRALRDLMRRTA
ncbi:MAG: alpha/beta hydrolase [Immundisolibacterales bacterium]|nr:alpha/beta hydrolase [Immundisolibacterales bacterium]